MKALTYLIFLLLPVFLSGQSLPIPMPEKGQTLLTDTAGIDRLNALSLKSIEGSKKDSAEAYSATAYYSSINIHYLHGVAQALSLLGFAKTYFYGSLTEAEILDKASIDQYEKISNQSGLGEAYERFAFVYFAQSKYDDALKYAESCYAFHEKQHDEIGIFHVLQLFTQIYLKRGQFDKAFDTGEQALQLSSKINNTAEVKGCLLGLGTVCMGIENYSLALSYYKKVFENFTPEDSLILLNSEDLVWAKMEYAEIYSHLGEYDSALHRYNLLDTTGISEKDLRIFLVSKGEYFMLRNQYHLALPLLLRGLAIHTRLNDGNEIVRTVLDIAKTYFSLHKVDSALRYARCGLVMGAKSVARQRMRDAYRLQYLIFEDRNQRDSAFFYYRKYVQTKESLTDDQTKGKFAAEEYVGKIALLGNEKAASFQKLKLQDQLLKKQAAIGFILIALVLVVLIVSVLLIRNIILKRKNELLVNKNAHRELIYKTNEMEMRALRAQMNPHFIFNCLNSINRFIMKNESQSASDYLTQFSRLVRMVLNNSKRAWISLEEEIAMLRLYLDMEKLRFKDGFGYRLDYEDRIDTNCLFIPPLLLQPFVENAIWHGLMHKKEHGLVTISFTMENDCLRCFIEDNGVGRSVSAKANNQTTQTHKSLGIRITGERLALINRQSGTNKVSFHIEDLIDSDGNPAGTRVCLSFQAQRVPPTADEAKTTVNIV